MASRLLIPALGALLLATACDQRPGGVVTDGQRPLAGVRVYPDRLPQVRPGEPSPMAVTDAKGRFRLELRPEDQVLVLEKEGHVRDFVPRAALAEPIRLAPLQLSRERVLVVRLEMAERPEQRSDAELRELLFDRRPGAASVANYVYEVSKGGLLLEEGRWLRVKAPSPAAPVDEARPALIRRVLETLKAQPLGDLDRVDNRTGSPGPDGKPDHLWIIAPGNPGSVTAKPGDFSPISLLMPLPWDRTVQWGALFFAEETPLGNLVHESFHAMGEHGVDDLYVADPKQVTAGAWDVMDAGMYRGWTRQDPDHGPWQQDMATSPAHPLGWTRAERWYQGRFAGTVPALTVETPRWEGWLDPLLRAPGALPQRLKVPDPEHPGAFWEFSVRWAWGFDRGRCGNRFGPGFQGLVVAHIDPSRLSTDGDSRGPVRVIDAHPGTPEPPKPRFPGGRWQLDDAAFNLGPGEQPRGQDGVVNWEVLEVDARGRMRVRVERRP